MYEYISAGEIIYPEEVSAKHPCDTTTSGNMPKWMIDYQKLAQEKTMNDTTDQKIDELWLLALARQHNEQAKARKNELLKKVEESLEFKEIISYLKTSESVIFALTASIKAEYAALAMKDEKGRYIQIHDSIIFKDSNTVTVAYDPARALEYSLKSFMPAVALNIGIFEKAAKEGLLPKDLVTVEKKTVPQAQIASDLRNLLEESEIPF